MYFPSKHGLAGPMRAVWCRASTHQTLTGPIWGCEVYSKWGLGPVLWGPYFADEQIVTGPSRSLHQPKVGWSGACAGLLAGLQLIFQTAVTFHVWFVILTGRLNVGFNKKYMSNHLGVILYHGSRVFWTIFLCNFWNWFRWKQVTRIAVVLLLHMLKTSKRAKSHYMVTLGLLRLSSRYRWRI